MIREADNEADSYIVEPAEGSEEVKIKAADFRLDAKD